jgi:hypothetical protein
MTGRADRHTRMLHERQGCVTRVVQGDRPQSALFGRRPNSSDYSRRRLSARLGTTKDARKIGKNLLPVHRKAITSPSAASKV